MRKASSSASGLAAEVLSDHWSGAFPVQPESIAEAMGITVISDPELSDLKLSGIFSEQNGRQTIRFNPHEPRVRQRFTIAHELGHYVLGHGGRRQAFRDETAHFNISVDDPMEASANRFAVALLMPANVIRFLVREKRITDINVLASKLQVSEAAIKFRLKSLGYAS